MLEIDMTNVDVKYRIDMFIQIKSASCNFFFTVTHFFEINTCLSSSSKK